MHDVSYGQLVDRLGAMTLRAQAKIGPSWPY